LQIIYGYVREKVAVKPIVRRHPGRGRNT